MATYNGTANNLQELLQGLTVFLTDPAAFGAGNAWQRMRPASTSDIVDEVILKGVGDGQDAIYIGFKIKPGAVSGQQDLVLNGFAGYDSGLTWEEQPGSIYHAKLPTLALVSNTFLTYWVSANTSRVILVVELSSQYESAYLGLMKPVAVERQYPYPLVVGGSYIEGSAWTNNTPGHSAFTNPGSDVYAGLGAYGTHAADNSQEDTTSLRVRRPDGSWRSGLNRSNVDKALHFEKLCVWPTNTEPVRTLTVYDKTLTIENVIMYPFLLYESYPVGILGQFDGVYWVGNREDLSAKDSIVYNDKVYKVFSNVFRRDNDQYFAIEWA
ncbi:Hypothetical protein LUCI_0776 [Lucifera butyrica]|uniref:Uncharacterized protein n=1 Tax=Lucifera butyrica TaxID=1351585 RepID=A0A498QZE7_9FIRM|nr:hypothetical protein [Lucifera butyrica]VBB05566.1 Hypothetical protein LUCI_0776 [Lucifera butyrica]